MAPGARIYVAGPLGFSEAGRHFYTVVLIPYLRGLGYEVVDPWSLADARQIEVVQTLRGALRRAGEEPAAIAPSVSRPGI
jgi:hypothetical protein